MPYAGVFSPYAAKFTDKSIENGDNHVMIDVMSMTFLAFCSNLIVVEVENGFLQLPFLSNCSSSTVRR